MKRKSFANERKVSAFLISGVFRADVVEKDEEEKLVETKLSFTFQTGKIVVIVRRFDVLRNLSKRTHVCFGNAESLREPGIRNLEV